MLTVEYTSKVKDTLRSNPGAFTTFSYDLKHVFQFAL
jgi:hypothetical protein